MKPAPFEYKAPATTDEAVDLLAEHGWDAKLLAGGQSLVPAMNFRLAQPAVLLDLNRIDELAYIRTVDSAEETGSTGSNVAEGDGGGGAVGLRIGAMTRQAALERSAAIAAHSPLLAAALPYIGHPQIRNRGTIGGSIAHADPAAELPAIVVALDAELTIRNSEGERRVAAAEFFQGLFSTALGPNDLLIEVDIPALPAGTGWSFQEVARRHGDYALVGVAATVRLAGDVCEAARMVFLSVGGGPVIASNAEASLVGQPLDERRIGEAARLAASEDIDPVNDIHASVAYRRHLAEVLARRALHEAGARARSGAGA
ncbi:MAG: xanthine dehydrogenase family protein subunit M [Acidobacteria bacterium]|nr:xanthine dehydrogenase family protein subunit M [Acidobacteriota bacterium]